MTTTYYLKPEHELADQVPADETFYNVYYRGLDEVLHQFAVVEEDAIEARRKVLVELASSNTKYIGAVMVVAK
jgi:uncharacterized protein Usg